MGKLCSSHGLTIIQKLSRIIQKESRLMLYKALNAQETEAKSFGFFNNVRWVGFYYER
ncbi:hypothetical protein DTO96_101757 [Ephemeroptericola cinctiostellae]|uniref:Uncharacterized protein n=1 Tax=Ephemeroptericola cinctiostellae TaxID=2268024 RepID=A0A345DCC9_9BURK|nr:hypothetical protein DTO96_101757 [Ephemeroptericola cinctiostellae]